jgi:hypothetical protein
MSPLSAATLLHVWERGRSRDPVERGLLLLAAAAPDSSREQLLAVSVGERDGRLLDMREALFGPNLSCRADCPACDSALEINVSIAEIRAGSRPEAGGGDHHLSHGAFRLHFRLPDSADLLALPAADGADPVRFLATRCLQQATREDRAVAVAELPDELLAVLAQAMVRADPRADIRFDFRCPDCGHVWQSCLDILTFFWTEIQARALRILGEVHLLAGYYGWREADILALTPARRRTYVEMVSG